jgi:hypothetical protein
MNAPPTTLVDAWDYRELVEAEAADLRRRFPEIMVWFGDATRHWWAVVESPPDSWHLIEANGPYDLCRLIDSARAALPDSSRAVVEISGRPPRRGSPGGRHARSE